MSVRTIIFLSIFSLTFFFLSSFLLLQMYFSSELHASSRTSYQDGEQILASSHDKKRSVESKKNLSISTATLAATGDILIHDTVYFDAKTEDGYDFEPMFSEVKPILKQSSITFSNQESMLGGSELGVSTYPRFNSPFEIGDALKDVGVDIVSMANNHTLDRGEVAIERAINYLNSIGIQQTGSFLSQEDKENIRTITANDITFSFLAYTYGTNGLPIPTGKDYLVNLIQEDKIIHEIHEAKKLSDLVVVSLHFGNEYQRIPTIYQKELVKTLVDEGADIILGHHPHVLQPIEWIDKPNGERAIAIYSLGNFISGQIRDYKDIGGIFQIRVRKIETHDKTKIELLQPAFLPTYVASQGFRNYRIVPLSDAGEYGLRNSDDVLQEIKSHMSQWMPDLTFTLAEE